MGALAEPGPEWEDGLHPRARTKTPARRGPSRPPVGGLLVGAVLGVGVIAALHGKVAGIDGWGTALTIGLWALAGGTAVLLGRLLGRLVRRRRYRLPLYFLLGLPCLWLFGDFQYFLLMKRCSANWEAGIERDSEGVRKGCREFTVGQGGPAVLFIHGFADSPAVFRRLAPALAREGFTCHAMRLPRFATPMANFRRTNVAEWREAVLGQLHRLRQVHSRVIVVAHSLGGAVALDCLTDAPRAADGLVLLAPLLDVSNEHSPLLPTETWFHLLDGTMLFTDRLGMPPPDPVKDPEVLKLMKPDRFIPRALYREVFSLVERNRRRLRGLDVPLLMVLARGDPVVDNKAAVSFFRRCTGPKQLMYMENVGHVLPMAPGWPVLVEDIARFNRELPGSPSGPWSPPLKTWGGEDSLAKTNPRGWDCPVVSWNEGKICRCFLPPTPAVKEVPPGAEWCGPSQKSPTPNRPTAVPFHGLSFGVLPRGGS